MSADLLRRAATILRELANGANEGYQPGDEDPWFKVPDANSIRTKWVSFAEAYEADAPYIATMHPGVGLALADWLDDEALMVETRKRITNSAALEVALLVVGGES